MIDFFNDFDKLQENAPTASIPENNTEDAEPVEMEQEVDTSAMQEMTATIKQMAKELADLKQAYNNLKEEKQNDNQSDL